MTTEYHKIENYRKLPARVDLGNGSFIEYVRDIELYRTQPAKLDENGNELIPEKTVLQDSKSEPMYDMDEAGFNAFLAREKQKAQEEADYMSYMYNNLIGGG